MQRETFPVSDLWQNGSVCKCGGAMKVLTMGHWEPNSSDATLSCRSCDRVITVKQIVKELSPGRSSLEPTI